MLHRDRLGLLFLIFTVATTCVVQLTNGDEALLKQVCAGTPAPDACDLCFTEDPDADQKDVRELADVAIQCSLSHGVIVSAIFGDIGNSSGDPLVKDKCASIGNATASIDDAESSWTNGRYSDAANQLGEAIDKLEDCSKVVPGIPSMPIFVEKFTLLKNYYLDTQAIVSKL